MPTATFDSGLSGVRTALAANRLIVIVDVFRFTSTVTTAVANGFTIIPSSHPEKAAELSHQTGITLAGNTGSSKYSLSPLDYLNPSSVEDVILFSPNGSACVEHVTQNGVGFIGSFLNARSVGRVLREESARTGMDVTVVAADEVLEDQYMDFISRRFALEDHLCAGFIFSELHMDLSPEAEVCLRAYETSKHDYVALLKNCLSGKYLIERGLEADISHCLQRNIYEIVPVMRDGKIISHDAF